jgi:hypothetical protein
MKGRKLMLDNNVVGIKLSPAQALVLFELLSRLDETRSIPIEHPAEQTILWLLEAELEKQVPVFDPDYRQLVTQAREAIERT